jgi:hypothetical protein
MSKPEFLDIEAAKEIEDRLEAIFDQVPLESTRSVISATYLLAGHNDELEEYLETSDRKLKDNIARHFDPPSTLMDHLLLPSHSKFRRSHPIVSDIYFEERSVEVLARGATDPDLEYAIRLKENRIIGDMVIGETEFLFSGSPRTWVGVDTLAGSHFAWFDYRASDSAIRSHGTMTTSSEDRHYRKWDLSREIPSLVAEGDLALQGILHTVLMIREYEAIEQR